MNNIELSDLWGELLEILSSMGVPNKRLSDLDWLGRNLGIKNKHHPDFGRAMELIRIIKKETAE